MPAPMLKLGQITIVPLSDGGFAPPPSAFMPTIPAALWNEEREHLNAEGNVPLNFGVFLVRDSDGWNLVDTGYGAVQGVPAGKLLGELEKAQVQPDEIQRVIITHLHPDHIGWNTVESNGKRELVFKNARYIVQRIDWDFFTRPEVMKDNPHIGAHAMPVMEAGHMDLLDGETAITDAITAIPTPGHTPGHQSLIISSGGEKAVIMGDTTHSTAQLNNEHWCPEFDMDADTSTRTRRDLFERIEREGLKICAGHYPYPSIGSIVRVEGKRRWQGI